MKQLSKIGAIGLAAALLLSGCAGADVSVGGENTLVTITAGQVSITTTTSKTSETMQKTTTKTSGSREVSSSSQKSNNPSTSKGSNPSVPTASRKPSNPPKSSTPRTSIIIEPPRTPLLTVAGMDTSWFALDASASTYNRRVRDALREVEQEMQCNLKFTRYTSNSLTEQAIKADRAGSKFADLMVTTMWQQRSLVAARVLHDLNKVDGVNLTRVYWDQAARRDMQLYGKNFIGFTTLDGTAAHANVLFFNKRLAKQVGTSDTDLYKMVSDGTWTVKAMMSLSQKAKKDLDGNGMDYKNDQYGFGGRDLRGEVGYAIFKAQGGYFAKQNSTGDYVYGLSDASNLSALRAMQVWLLKDSSVLSAGSFGVDVFKGGRLLFWGAPADTAGEFTTMKDDWGILPYPKAEVGGRYVSTVSWNTQGLCIPRKVKGIDLENAAMVMELIAQKLDGVRKEQEKDYNRLVYRDSQVFRMMEIVKNSMSVDFCQFGDMGPGGLSTVHYLIDNASNEPATRVASVKEETISRMNTYLKAVKSM